MLISDELPFRGLKIIYLYKQLRESNTSKANFAGTYRYQFCQLFIIPIYCLTHL